MGWENAGGLTEGRAWRVGEGRTQLLQGDDLAFVFTVWLIYLFQVMLSSMCIHTVPFPHCSRGPSIPAQCSRLHQIFSNKQQFSTVYYLNNTLCLFTEPTTTFTTLPPKLQAAGGQAVYRLVQQVLPLVQSLLPIGGMRLTPNRLNLLCNSF